ncbi:class I SAM-dependent methyltransferase [Streptomyces sp. NPDC060194]|uniref:class I SAM-dependent methyltransferase n=1 Tax=Streptomyces sp. NPDC060194 TaxID=3347069 RepID=UPI003659B6D4
MSGTRATGPAAPASAPWLADPYTEALRRGRGPLFLRCGDGQVLPLDVERWCAAPDTADLSVLRRCRGSVLDIGCGPGRLVASLAARGHRVLGIDVSDAAVARTLGLGGTALLRSVFEPLPGEGRWETALLVDGNLGIGGDPGALLARIAEVLAPGGLLIAETSSLDVDERMEVRIEDGEGAPGAVFPWARLGAPALHRYAGGRDWRPVAQWTAGGRPFVALRRTRTSRTAYQRAEPANSAADRSSQRVRNTSAGSPVADV